MAVPGFSATSSLYLSRAPYRGHAMASQTYGDATPFGGADYVVPAACRSDETSCPCLTHKCGDGYGFCLKDCKEPGSHYDSCAAACRTEFCTCNPYCANIETDVNNCGSCGRVCAAPANATASCSKGACGSWSCIDGFAQCGTTCTNLSSDQENCGSCGNSCSGQTICQNGQCVSPLEGVPGDCQCSSILGFNCSTQNNNCGPGFIPQCACSIFGNSCECVPAQWTGLPGECQCSSILGIGCGPTSNTCSQGFVPQCDCGSFPSLGNACQCVPPQDQSSPPWFCSLFNSTICSLSGGNSFACSYISFLCDLASSPTFVGGDSGGGPIGGYQCYESCVVLGGDPTQCQTSCGYQPPASTGCCGGHFDRKTGQFVCTVPCTGNRKPQ